jgi:hypothetical protein
MSRFGGSIAVVASATLMMTCGAPPAGPSEPVNVGGAVTERPAATLAIAQVATTVFAVKDGYVGDPAVTVTEISRAADAVVTSVDVRSQAGSVHYVVNRAVSAGATVPLEIGDVPLAPTPPATVQVVVSYQDAQGRTGQVTSAAKVTWAETYGESPAITAFTAAVDARVGGVIRYKAAFSLLGVGNGGPIQITRIAFDALVARQSEGTIGSLRFDPPRTLGPRETFTFEAPRDLDLNSFSDADALEVTVSFTDNYGAIGAVTATARIASAQSASFTPFTRHFRE